MIARPSVLGCINCHDPIEVIYKYGMLCDFVGQSLASSPKIVRKGGVSVTRSVRVWGARVMNEITTGFCLIYFCVFDFIPNSCDFLFHLVSFDLIRFELDLIPWLDKCWFFVIC